jgi:hypothetical protein
VGLRRLSSCAARLLQSDDINKFLWFVRIGGGVYPDELNENEYYTNQGVSPRKARRGAAWRGAARHG